MTPAGFWGRVRDPPRFSRRNRQERAAWGAQSPSLGTKFPPDLCSHPATGTENSGHDPPYHPLILLTANGRWVRCSQTQEHPRDARPPRGAGFREGAVTPALSPRAQQALNVLLADAVSTSHHCWEQLPGKSSFAAVCCAALITAWLQPARRWSSSGWEQRDVSCCLQTNAQPADQTPQTQVL